MKLKLQPGLDVTEKAQQRFDKRVEPDVISKAVEWDVPFPKDRP